MCKLSVSSVVGLLLCLVLGWSNLCRGDGASTGGNSTVDPLSVILLQGFNWESSKSGSWYSQLEGSVKEVAGAGFTDVWLPPSSQSVSPQGYMPSKLYDLDSSKYGNKEQLKGLVGSYHQNGVRAVADIVINHRCGSKQDGKGYWCIFEGGAADDRMNWGSWAIPPNDKPYPCGSGQADTGDDYTAAPDVDHTNPKVQSDLVDWMNWLKSEIGFDGWRFDFVKGYAGRFVGQYVTKTQAAFAVGELWDSMSYQGGSLDPNQDAHRQRLVDWVHSTGGASHAFDFTTKGILQVAVNGQLGRMRDSNGKPPGMIGLLPEKAVTLVENHDTGSTQNLWPFPSDKIMQGYAYILTHPGTPSVFYDHFFQFKDQIKALIAIRKRNNIKANSTVKILAADADLYMAAIGDTIVMKIGPRTDLGNLLPSQPFHVAASGNDYCVWEKKAAS